MLNLSPESIFKIQLRVHFTTTTKIVSRAYFQDTIENVFYQGHGNCLQSQLWKLY